MTAYATVPGAGTAQVGAAQDRDALLARADRRMSALLTAERDRWSAVHPAAAAPIEAVQTLVAAGGKRLRPAFLISGFLAAGGPAEHAGQAVDAAAAMEFLHAFLLLHDDVFDNSPLRRGVSTAHERHADRHRADGWAGESRRYGEGVATLAGDLAHAYADRLVADLPGAAREIWLELREEVLIGQYLDLRAAAERIADPRLSRWIAICKSGRYSIQRPLALGATLAGRTDLVEVFHRFGEALGEAFQLRDDLIDAYGTTEVTGKPARLDFAEHKMTLLLALAVQLDERVPALLSGAGADSAALGTALVDLGVRDQVERHIDDLVAEAAAVLDDTDLRPGWRETFARMAVQVAYRDH